MEPRDSMPEQGETISAEQAVVEIRNTVDRIKPMSRREFLRDAGLLGFGAFLTACGIKPDEIMPEEVSTSIPVPTEKPLEGTEREYSELGYTLVQDPYRINPQEFITGDKGVSTAIVENFPFPDIDGSKYTLKYGSPTEEVTYLHYSGKKPPVAGEILPLVYKLTEETKAKGVEVVPYAISVQANQPKEVEFTNEEYLVMPIVTSGSDSGIVPTTYEGRIMNTNNPNFEVQPDPYTGSRNGYLSWALLRKSGTDLIVEGVINNTQAKIFVDYKNIPEEILNLYTK